MYIRKKTFILIITYLAAAVVALGAYTAVHFGMEGSYRRTAEYGYAHAFEEVVGSVSALSDSLHRASYASGAELSGQLCADIYGSCLAAEMTMAVLPFSTQELEQTAAFIGIAGDYARGSLRTSAQSGFDNAARRNFASLYKTAAALTQELSELRDEINDGEVLLDEPENVFADSGDRLSASMLGIEDGVGATELDGYDGKYAKTAQSTGKKPIAQSEAKAIAAEFFGLDKDKLEAEYSAENGTVCFAFNGGRTLQISSSFSHSAAFLWKMASLFSSTASICSQMAFSFSVAMAVVCPAVSGAAAKAAADAPMADTINASASAKLKTVFFFMVCYAPF